MRYTPRWWMGWAVLLGLLVGCDRPPEPPAPPGGVEEPPPPAGLAVAELVKDLADSTLPSSPREFVEVNGAVFFSAADALHGRELWKSDGTPAGTVLVKDAMPGAEGLFPNPLIRAGDHLFFSTYGGLWKSDGTAGGTVRLEPDDSLQRYTPIDPTDVKGTLFLLRGYYTSRPSNPLWVELWTSDGTKAGTRPIKDFWAKGARGIQQMRSANGLGFFVTGLKDLKYGLWRSDGTEEGTVLLREFQGGSASPPPLYPVGLDRMLLFQVSTPQGKTELWRSDGTREGTVPVVLPSAPGWQWPHATPLVRLGNRVLFQARDDAHGYALWKSDGTDTGTELIKDLNPGGESSPLEEIVAARSGFFFFTRSAPGRFSLWWSDATEAGTVLVKDLDFGACCNNPTRERSTMGDVLYFVPEHEKGVADQLWTSDGTATGTRSLQSFNPDDEPLTRLGVGVGGRLLFQADDGLHGAEPWTSDGTVEGTRLLADLHTVTGDAGLEQLANVAGALYFSTRVGNTSWGLWKSDGARTEQLDAPPGRFKGVKPRHFTPVDGTLYFSAGDEQGVERLWKSDGTKEGTVRVSSRAVLQNGLTAVNGTLFFQGSDPEHGSELWKSDGTEAGTVLVKDLVPGKDSFRLLALSRFQDRLFFATDDNSWGRHGLWKSDGTSEGTMRVKDFGIASLLPYGVDVFVALDDTLVFSAQDSVCGSRLWATDGTEAGTVPLHDCSGSLPSPSPEGLTRVGNEVLFFGSSEGHSWLWKSDGTRAGTVRVKQVSPVPLLNAGHPVNVAGTLFFVGRDETSRGYQLWKSDGTEAGTVPVKAFPHADIASFWQLTAVNEWLLLSVGDGTHGTEAWVSDGTEAGTQLLADVDPGAGSSSPSLFTRLGAWLYFKARHPQYGEELWRVPLSVLPGPPQTGNGKTETPALEAAPAPEPDTKLEGLGCGVTSGAQSAGWSGLLLLGWLRARRRRRTP